MPPHACIAWFMDENWGWPILNQRNQLRLTATDSIGGACYN